jgi:cystathionine beta-lyase/cystathionine gamma-synthase
MVQSIEQVLEQAAQEDAIPYIIAEIPTNPRVEVPDLIQLKAALSKVRNTKNGTPAVEPVFILDQTFCPNIHFLGKGEVLSSVRALSYASGSKFPSGGKCTAGYCVANQKAEPLMQKIEEHLNICDNEATALQYEILAAQLPSMNKRIHDAYLNTREFVNFIQKNTTQGKNKFCFGRISEGRVYPFRIFIRLTNEGRYR